MDEEQAETTLASAYVGSWVFRQWSTNKYPTLSVKATADLNMHYQVRKEGNLWFQMDEDSGNAISRGFTFEALLKDCEAKPAMGQNPKGDSSIDTSLADLRIALPNKSDTQLRAEWESLPRTPALNARLPEKMRIKIHFSISCPLTITPLCKAISTTMR